MRFISFKPQSLHRKYKSHFSLILYTPKSVFFRTEACSTMRCCTVPDKSWESPDRSRFEPFISKNKDTRFRAASTGRVLGLLGFRCVQGLSSATLHVAHNVIPTGPSRSHQDSYTHLFPMKIEDECRERP